MPASLAIGDIISYSNERISEGNDRKSRYTFAGSIYFKRMKEKGLYTTDIDLINTKVKKLNLDNIFEQKLI